MSLVTLIRDYVDVAMDSSVTHLDGSALAYHTTVFLFTVVKQAILYCLTFHWLRDLSYFCFTPESVISSLSEGGESFSHLLAFSEVNSSPGLGIVFLGFFNGCLSCLHVSAAQIVMIRRMLVQGVPAGICSALGTAVGQACFLGCVLFGFRGVLFPWLALEPLGYICGTAIIFSVASAMAQDRRTPTLQWSAKYTLLIYAFTNGALAWCEQTAIFQWVGNCSLGAEPTFLETVPSMGSFQQLARNSSYLVAFFLGSVLGGCLIGFLLQRFLEFLLRRSGVAVYYGLVKQANLPLATLAFAFGFGSMPYYGFDYLLTKGFGFLPQEKIFQQTLFSPINLVSKTSQSKEPSQGRLEDQLALPLTLEGERSKSFAIDTTPFDNGQYLKASQKRPQTFEDLNYRGEHLWTNRFARISHIKEQANQTQSSFLGPVFSWMRSFLWGDVSPSVAGAGSADPAGNFLSSVDNKSAGNPIIDNGIVEPVQVQDKADRLQPELQVQDLRYQLINSNNLAKEKELSPGGEQMNHYVKEFDQQFDRGFSTFYDADPPSLIEVEDQWQEKRIKERCYTNPIYKFLLNVEIDSFLARQPASHWLSPEEEGELLERRQLLGKYYDTLALTSQVGTSEAFEQLVPKSYADRVYNHQFKGTLKVARRLFSVKANPGGNLTTPVMDRFRGSDGDAKNSDLQSRLVKFDQLLFSKGKNNPSETLFHEEMAMENSVSSDGLANALAADRVSLDKDTRLQTTLQDGNLSTTSIMPSDNKVPEKGSLGVKESGAQVIHNTFSLEQVEPTPLYAAWDTELRKLVLTNRFQNRTLAGYAFSDFTRDEKGKTTVFTIWPIPKPLGTSVDTSINKTKGHVAALLETSGQQSDMSSLLEKNEAPAHQLLKPKTHFLFRNEVAEPVTNEMVNTLLYWQKSVSNQEIKQVTKEDKQKAKQKLASWPENVRRASWGSELMDVEYDVENDLENDLELEEIAPISLKKKAFLWEFTPPDHGGFIWSAR